MRIFLIALALVGMNLGLYGNSGKKSSGGSVQNSDKAKRYYGYAEDYKKQAKAALEQGKTAKAKALTECAMAKLKMAKAYETGDKALLAEGQADYGKAREALKAASSCKKKDSSSCKKKTSSKSDDLKAKIEKQAKEIEELKKAIQELKDKK